MDSAGDRRHQRNCIIATMVIWSEILVVFIHLIGITDNMNGLFIVCIAFIIVILVSLTSIISKQAEKRN